MQIETVTRYTVNGREFGSEKAAREYLGDMLGEIMQEALNGSGRVLGPGDHLAINAALIKNAATLAPILQALADGVTE